MLLQSSPAMMDPILSLRCSAPPFQLLHISTSTCTSTAACYSPWTSLSRFSTGRSCIFGLKLTGYLSQGWHFTASKRSKSKRKQQQQQSGSQLYGLCRAALADDAPFALAIGASILSTVVLPTIGADQGPSKEDESLLGADEVLSGAMQIISFIPLFNWLVWVLAWLDSRKPLYLVFSAVYLAPYLKTGLSLSPEDSWLPIGSVLACIVHVQIYLSISRGNRY